MAYFTDHVGKNAEAKDVFKVLSFSSLSLALCINVVPICK